jgi:hypothetical protein
LFLLLLLLLPLQVMFMTGWSPSKRCSTCYCCVQNPEVLLPAAAAAAAGDVHDWLVAQQKMQYMLLLCAEP